MGFNQWDEVWENGDIDSTTGANVYGVTTIRTKNYIPVIPGQTYYMFFGSRSGQTGLKTRWYDSNKAYIGVTPTVMSNATVTAPANACYLRFVTQSQWNYTSYRHDICFNLSDPSRNGQYEPYSAHTYPLDSTLTLRGIPVLTDDGKITYDGDQYAPDGIVMRRYGIVDLGTLSWSRGEASPAGSGVYRF